MDWYGKFIKKAERGSLLSILVNLYALELMSSSKFNIEDHGTDLLYYAHDVKHKLVEAIYEACINRIHRISDRIFNMHSCQEVDLVSSGILQNNHPKLWSIIASGNPGNKLTNIQDVYWFYKELYSDDINKVYPRGERNNKPWLNIVNRTLKLMNSRGIRDVIVAIDGVKDAIHNTGESIIGQISQGEEILAFLNATANNDQSELFRFIYKYADKHLIDMRIIGQELGR